MKLKVSSGGVPAGNYMGQFEGVEPFQDKENKYAPGLRWSWKIMGGAQAGQVASRITGPQPSPKNACGKILCGLLGRPLQADEEIDVQPFVGKPFLIIVAPGETGTRVDVVTSPLTP